MTPQHAYMLHSWAPLSTFDHSATMRAAIDYDCRWRTHEPERWPNSVCEDRVELLPHDRRNASRPLNAQVEVDPSQTFRLHERLG
jgi:hypothetical protein